MIACGIDHCLQKATQPKVGWGRSGMAARFGALRRAFVERGWVRVPGAVEPRHIGALRDAVAELTQSAALIRHSTECFDVDEQHLAPPRARPQLRKIKRPHLWHPAFNAVIDHEHVLDVVMALLHVPSHGCATQQGDDPSAVRTRKGHRSFGHDSLRFHGDKVVVKGPGGVGQPVVCHQDWAFYPHSNDSLCTVSIVLSHLTLEAGGLAFASGSHRSESPVYSHHCRESGQFIGAIDDERFDAGQLQWEAPECVAGDILIHHARTVHASPANMSQIERPLLLLQYVVGDAWPLQQHSRGAWGIDLPAGSVLDEWELFERGLVRGGGTHVPRMRSTEVAMPVPWPGRGSLGALYRQLGGADRSTCHLDPAVVCVIPADDVPEASTAQHRAGSRMSRLSKARESSNPKDVLEWHRLMHFVGSGPYGSLSGSTASRKKLLRALFRATGSEHHHEDDAYDALHRCFWESIVGTKDHDSARGWATDRSRERADEVLRLVHPMMSVKSHGNDGVGRMLDIGCADGRITALIGQGLGMDKADVVGCDSVQDMHVGEGRRDPGFTFVQLPPFEGLAWSPPEGPRVRLLPFEDESFSVVTALMTLHHIRDLKGYLDEVFRVLRPGGVFVFREHDVRSQLTADVLDFVHGMHFRTWVAQDHPNYRPRGWMEQQFRAYYQSRSAWHRAITAAGLRRVLPDGAACDEEQGLLESVTAAAVDVDHPSVEFTNPKRVFFGQYMK